MTEYDKNTCVLLDALQRSIADHAEKPAGLVEAQQLAKAAKAYAGWLENLAYLATLNSALEGNPSRAGEAFSVNERLKLQRKLALALKGHRTT